MTGGSQVVVRTPGGGTAIPIVIEPGAQVVLRTPGVQGDVGPASAGPVGGTTGQALVKTSNADHATGWAAPAPAAHAASHGSAGSDPVTLAQSQVANLATDLAAKVPKSLYDAHTVLASVTDDTPAALTVAEQTILGRITGGNIAALTVAQVKTLLAMTAADVGAAWTAAKAGTWINPTGGVGASTSLTNAMLFLSPWPVTVPCTIDRIGLSIAVAGSAGALLRPALYKLAANGVDATLVLDPGTIDGTQAAGDYSFAISQALTPGVYLLGGVMQGAPATPVKTWMNTTMCAMPWMLPQTSHAGCSNNGAGYTATGITGALPANLSPIRNQGQAIYSAVRFA